MELCSSIGPPWVSISIALLRRSLSLRRFFRRSFFFLEGMISKLTKLNDCKPQAILYNKHDPTRRIDVISLCNSCYADLKLKTPFPICWKMCPHVHCRDTSQCHIHFQSGIDLFKTDSQNFGNHICMRSHGVFSTNHERAAHLRILQTNGKFGRKILQLLNFQVQ